MELKVIVLLYKWSAVMLVDYEPSQELLEHIAETFVAYLGKDRVYVLFKDLTFIFTFKDEESTLTRFKKSHIDQVPTVHSIFTYEIESESLNYDEIYLDNLLYANTTINGSMNYPATELEQCIYRSRIADWDYRKMNLQTEVISFAEN